MTDTPKPPVGEMPTDAELEQMDPPGDEPVADEEFLARDKAREDDTIDDEERDVE
jgi:hypothetical protein